MSLTLEGRKYDTAVENMIKNMLKKKQSSIAPRVLIKTRNFIIVMGFPGNNQRQGLDYWNINILCHNFLVDCCVCLSSIIYFTC